MFVSSIEISMGARVSIDVLLANETNGEFLSQKLFFKTVGFGLRNYTNKLIKCHS